MYTLNKAGLTLWGVLFGLLLQQLAPTYAQSLEGHKSCSQYGGTNSSPVPHYSIERKYHSDGDPRILNLYIALETRAFGKQDLISLVCKLNADFPSDVIIRAWMFDDRRAARNLALRHQDQDHYIEYLSHLKAHYELDRAKGSEFVEFLFPELHGELPRFDRIEVRLDTKPKSP